MVYVLSCDGSPLMPTKRHGKIRHLLLEGKAKVVNRTPFTVMLLYGGSSYTQNIILGIDAGSKHIGVSAVTEKEEVYAAEVELRSDITDNLSTRREMRRARRNRKIRYRKARFQNRRRCYGWLAPTVQQKVNTHLKVVADVHKLLPITKIVVETASFDIQKIKNPEIQGVAYQKGEQLQFWNVREYVLFRDSHICQCCNGKSKDKILNVHHIESRKTGGDAPNNLITLCETCHKGYHQGKVKLPGTIKRGMKFSDASFMGVMRWAFYNKLKECYPNVNMTFGYITKNIRIENSLPKEHYIDARCITGNPNAKQLETYYYFKKVRCHNRQLHKMSVCKGGTRKVNQAPKYVFGFQLFDKVIYKEQECFVFGRRSSGSFDIRTLSGEKISAGVSHKRLKVVEKRKTMLVEKRSRTAVSSPCPKAGVSTVEN